MVIFQNLIAPRPDPLVEIAQLHRRDPRAGKIDLGLGTYRDDAGQVGVLRAVKRAEADLQAHQDSKAYLGPAGDEAFCDLLLESIFPDLAASKDGRVARLGVAGGTGALRLGLELVAHATPWARLLIGTPTWPNHAPLAQKAGLASITYRHYDPQTGSVDFDALCQVIERAREGDMLLLHGCCHNPSGANFRPEQWSLIADMIARRRLVPLIDIAYAGLAKGYAEDVRGARMLIEALPEAIIAISCSKNFGLYRERTGMLLAVAETPAQAMAIRQTAETLARLLWSNPPDHGAAIVRTILADPALRTEWQSELETMRHRLIQIRQRLAAASSGPIDLRPVAEQEGLFALLPISPDAIDRLRAEHGIYIAGSGRINIAGLNTGNLDAFLDALATCAAEA